MKDNDIVNLFLARSEDAILALQEKYQRYGSYIAYNILYNKEDADECVNQAYLKMWNSIPPHKPENLAAYLGKIIRNLALDMFDRQKAQKRGAGQLTLAYEELQDCIATSNQMESIIDEIHLGEILNQFLWELPRETRQIFIRRYWYLSPIKEIATDYHLSESKVKMSLLRTRKKLKDFLEKEGIDI